MDDDDKPFTPETLADYAKQIEDMRNRLLFESDDAGADAVAEQHFLVALGHLELAHRAMKLANLAQMRALPR